MLEYKYKIEIEIQRKVPKFLFLRVNGLPGANLQIQIQM